MNNIAIQYLRHGSSTPLPSWRQLVAVAASAASSSSAPTDLVATPTPTPNSSYVPDGTTSSRGTSDDGALSRTPPMHTITHTSAHNQGVAYYMYIFLGAMIAIAVGSVLVYCFHQRRLERFVANDNANNNMQRHSLIDSFIEAGEVEWQCTVCYHENHPAKRECLMCGTPQVISQQVAASPAHGTSLQQRSSSLAFAMPPPTEHEQQSMLAARNRSFHVRRLNEMNLTQRQRGARRRNLWQRARTDDGQFRWVRMDDCRPSRLSQLDDDADRPSVAQLVPQTSSPPSTSHGSTSRSRRSEENDSNSNSTSHVDDVGAYIFSGASRGNGAMTHSNGSHGVETQLTMSPTDSLDGQHFEPMIRVKRDAAVSSSAGLLQSPTASDPSDGGGSLHEPYDLIAQPSVGYVRRVDDDGHVEWIPAEMHVHEATTIDRHEFPRASTVIDFESIAALSFRQKVRWFLQEIDNVSTPWEEGHLLLKIRREAVLNESMHLLMLVPASDLRQRLRIEFIDEPGLDAGGLMREWVLLLCEKLFDEAFGLFQPTHVENLGYWLNPNAKQIHRDHLRCYEFVGRLIAKCLLEGQLLTVHFALPLLKHILGVPISFSDLEFLDDELYRNALWVRDHDGAEALCLDFTVQRIDGNDVVITDELVPGGKDVSVTDANKHEYLTLLMKHKMFASVQEPVTALLKGLYDVLPRNLLAAFDYQELELLLCGVPQIDVDDWEDHTDVKYQAFDTATKAERRLIGWFWEIVRRFSQEQRARLLQFVTGTSRVPVEGFKALLSNDGRVRRFGIQLVSRGTPPAGLYPKAHTCFNRIDLPQYNTKEELETYLTLVINMEITGFSMQ